MKILVIGGMHGNEPLGIGLVKKFLRYPVKNIDVIFANEEAIKRNSRFIKRDLNRSFPGDDKSRDYETRRASFLLNLSKKYDLVLDFHNTHCPNNDCTFVGESATDLLFEASSWMGLKKVIVANYDCMNKYSPNCISVEISLNSKLVDQNIWYKKIILLSKMKKLKE